MEFRDKPMQNLVRIPEKDICKNAQKLLLDGETIVGAYKTVRDQVVFTTHRIILVDMQGVTGTRQEIFVLPYRKVLHFGIQTAGFGDPLQASQPVSYTHLDVYKRQVSKSPLRRAATCWGTRSLSA